MSEHRAELRRDGEGRWSVIFADETIVQASAHPELAACCALAARGITGRLVFQHKNGTPAGGLCIEVGAAKAAKAAEAA